MDMVSLALARAYTRATAEGMGAVKGKNCTIQSVTDIDGGRRIVFAWTKNDGTATTSTLDVMDGKDGKDGAGADVASIPLDALEDMWGG